MLTPLWLAVAGLPVFQHPLPEAPHRPAAIALAMGEVSLRRPCLRLACPAPEWQPPTPARTYAYRDAGEQPVRRALLPGAPRPGRRALPAPARPDWVAPYAGLDRVGGRYGRRVVDTAATDVEIEVGTGYRWQPYVDNGGADTGPVARGQIRLRQKLGERAELQQQTRVESGRDNTFVRNSLGVAVELKPQWRLRSDVEIRHDTAADGGDGRTDAEGSVRVQYAF
jgi:hypothetical protein